MLAKIQRAFPLFALFCAALFLVDLGLIFFYAPVERSMGIVQKIFYSHVPAAMAAYAGFTITAICSVVYLLKPDLKFDMIARSGANVGMLFCLYVLISGPLWGYKAWGRAWTWDPQLTSTFILFMLYGGYVLLRWLSANTAAIRKIASVLAIIAFVDIPVIHYSVQKWAGLHPTVERSGGGGLAPDVKLVFSISMLTFLLLFICLIWLDLRTRSLQAKLDALHLEAEGLARDLA